MSRPARSPSRDFRNLAPTQADEDAYDYVAQRKGVVGTSLVGSVAHLAKGALGGGLLSGHVAYMKAGVVVALPMSLFFGGYMCYCLHLLVQSAQILYRRTRIPSMSYSDVGEAACMIHGSSAIAKLARPFRYTIDIMISMDLFGSCCCYHIIIARQIKQLVENTHETHFEGLPGYPGLRIYMGIMIPLIILICLIRHLKYLAPFSIAANVVVVLCILMAIYYAFERNPTFISMKPYTTLYGTFECIGMSVFSMACVGVVLPIENSMSRPEQFPKALTMGMAVIVIFTCLLSFFGYAAFLDRAESPITINFPMGLFPKILKGLIAVMIYVTHALNFWVPFNIWFYYLKKRHPPQKQVFWELIYRALFVIAIGVVSIIFPDINAIMGFIGAFCLSNMAFTWPVMIHTIVIWNRPGLGHMRWRLWRAAGLLFIGFFVFVCGTLVNAIELVSVFIKVNIQNDADNPNEIVDMP